MRRVVMETQVVVYDRVVRVVRLDQVLQRSRALFGSCFDIVYFDGGDVDSLVIFTPSAEESGQ